MFKLENTNIKKQNLIKFKYTLSNNLISYLGTLEEESSKDNSILKIKLDSVLLNKEIVGFNLLYSLLKANDTILHPNLTKPKSHKQTLNIDNNILSRQTIYNVDGVNIGIESTKFLDVNQAIIYHQYIFYTDKEIDLDFYHGIEDISSNDELRVNRITSSKHEKLLSAKYKNINLKHMMLYKKNFRHINHNKKNQGLEHYKINAVPNRKYKIVRYAGVFLKNEKKFRKELNKHKNYGFKKVLSNHIKNWQKDYSKYKIKIVNNFKVNSLVNFSIYKMLTNYPNAQGLMSNNFKNYKWLNDVFINEFYLINKVEYARKIIKQRIDNLIFAKETAKEFNYQGALYLDNPNQFIKGFRQIYLSGLIAYSLDRYYERTHDFSILTDGGLLMLFEICKFYASYAKINATKTHYDILNVSNIDNSIANIDNHNLTNYLIKNAFKLLNKYSKLYKNHDKKNYKKLIAFNNLASEIKAIKNVNRRLYLSGLNKNHILPIYQDFLKDYKSGTLEEVSDKLNFTNDIYLLLILFSEDFSDFVKQKNKDFYQSLFINSHFNDGLSSLIATKEVDEQGFVNFIKAFNLEKSSFLIKEKGINYGAFGMIYYYIVYHLAKLKIDNQIITIDSLLPKDIRRVEFKISYFNKTADIKIKRNSARLEWI
ncbi:MAG: hypothetical protein ACOCV1_03865 [Bacillota bacterium]